MDPKIHIVQVQPLSSSGLVGLRECEHLRLSYDPVLEVLWARFDSPRGPYFSLELLQEMAACIDALEAEAVWLIEGEAKPIKYVVIGARERKRFSLGGDLAFFQDCIRTSNRAALQRYGRACVDVLYRWSRVLSERITTIALVEGKALGGGFECALGCQYIIADERATFGFPEVLFNLFPGMGGFSFLARKVGVSQAEHLIAHGNQYSAAVMRDRGVVDALAVPGQGERAVDAFIRTHRARYNTRRAVEKMKLLVAPIGYDELFRIVDMWVDVALSLSDRDLRRLDLLVGAQSAELRKSAISTLRAI